MVKYRSHWACIECISPVEGREPAASSGVQIDGNLEERSPEAGIKLRALNIYCGIGGNRKLWGDNIEVIAVERDPKIAAAYKSLYPNDQVIITDAHQYLLKNYSLFDFIWASPPCQSHSRMNYMKPGTQKKYPDLSLYQEIILLKTFCKVPFVVENVNPYYDFIAPDYRIGRHAFWCNFKITDCHVDQVPNFIELRSKEDKQIIMNWLDIHVSKNLYSSGKNFVQVFKNCVHPKIGLSIFKDAVMAMKTKAC